MEVIGKIVLMPKGQYDPAATYDHLDWVRYNGTSWVCKQDNVSGITPVAGATWSVLAEDGVGASLTATHVRSGSITTVVISNSDTGAIVDTFTLEDGDSLTATHSKSGTTTTITILNSRTGAIVDTFDIEDGQSGSGSGDMVSTDFVGSTATTSVWMAENLKKSDGTLINADDVGGGDWSQTTSKPFNSVGSDFNVSSVSGDPDADGILELSANVTNKLTNLDKVDLTSSASDDEVLAWDSAQGKYTPKVAKGGHDMIDTIDDVLSNTDDKKVVDALVVKQFGNRYTERVVMTLQADHDTIGTWQDGEPSTWVVDDTHFLILENFYEADDEEIEFTFLFDSSNSEPIYIGGYQYVSQTVKNGKNCGALCSKCGNAPSVDTQIAVDITRVRFDNVVVV